MDTTELLARWSTMSLADIEAELETGENQAAAEQLLGSQEVNEIRDDETRSAPAGPPEAVEQLIQACHTGPSMAHVLDVDVRDAADPGRTGFHQETTA